jgi:DNA-binding CsgD family transcriptional regulator
MRVQENKKGSVDDEEHNRARVALSVMTARADRTPMWPNGLLTRVCRSCHTVTVLEVCAKCGHETLVGIVYNQPTGNAGTRWGLTLREAEVMAQVAAGFTNAQIATRLGTSEKTTKEQLSRARGKMGACNRMQAARMWWEAEAA